MHHLNKHIAYIDSVEYSLLERSSSGTVPSLYLNPILASSLVNF